MSEVWFYLLADASSATQQRFIVRFAEMALKRQRQTFIYSTDAQMIEQIDQALWVQAKPSSFIAHGIDFNCPAPIQLLQQQFPPQGDILLNLSDELLNVTGYQRIVEIINPDNREASRTRWRHYQQLGLTPELKPIA